jgi:hypothetical protein
MLAPSRASLQAIAKPMPRLAPEMKTVLPCNAMAPPGRRRRASVVHIGGEVNLLRSVSGQKAMGSDPSRGQGNC